MTAVSPRPDAPASGSGSPATRRATTVDLAFIAASPGAADLLGPKAHELGGWINGSKAGRPAALLAIAIWGLRQGGRIDLQLVKGKALGFIPRTDLVVRRRSADGEAVGLDAALLQALEHEDGRDVGQLVTRWFGGRVDEAQTVALVRIQKLVAETGLVRITDDDAGRGVVGGLLLGKTKRVLHPVTEAVQGVTADLEGLASDWLDFLGREATLAGELVNRVKKAIDGREQPDDDGPDFD